MKPVVKLLGEDGNVFFIIGKVKKVLQKEVDRDVANEYANKCFAAGSYDEVLRITMDYVEVE